MFFVTRFYITEFSRLVFFVIEYIFNTLQSILRSNPQNIVVGE